METTGNTEDERSMNLLKINEVAQWLNVSHDMVMNLVNTGKLPAHRISSKVVRFSKADVIAFLEDTKRNDCNSP